MKISSHRLPRIALSAAALLGVATVLACAATPAAAADGVAVSYGDLDLQRTQDVRMLHRRLERAAAQVCGEVSPLRLDRYRAYQRCVHAAVASAVREVGSPELADYQREHVSARSWVMTADSAGSARLNR